MKSLSIIIPCYNESKNLSLLISKCKEISQVNLNIEIIIVDNGSNDDTSIVLDQLTSGLSFIKRVKININQGYGYGVMSGLAKAKGQILCWTHADLQTDLNDVIKGMRLFENDFISQNIFVKGIRQKRPLVDVFFTTCMSFFETLLLRKFMWDINAQPTIFTREFFLTWESPPNDFSLDLYAYYMAKKSKLEIKRFPVLFTKRINGNSNWNIDFKSRYNFIRRTVLYSIDLKKKMK